VAIPVRTLLGILLRKSFKDLLDLSSDHLKVLSEVRVQENSLSVPSLDQIQQELIQSFMMHLVYDELKHAEDARVQQVSFVWIVKKDLHHRVEDVVLDNAQNALTILRSDDGLEELYDFDVDLSGVELAKVRDLVEDLIFNEENAHISREGRVLYKLGKELQNQAATLLQHLTKLQLSFIN
jgi:hypothetical protein